MEFYMITTHRAESRNNEQEQCQHCLPGSILSTLPKKKQIPIFLDHPQPKVYLRLSFQVEQPRHRTVRSQIQQAGSHDENQQSQHCTREYYIVTLISLLSRLKLAVLVRITA